MNYQSGKIFGKNIIEGNSSKGFFKSLKNSDFDRPGTLDPLISLAARSSYMRFSKDYQTEDIDKFRDELFKLKEEVNRKRHEMTIMKIEYAKLEEDNNKNVKIIENFLTEAGKNVGEFLLGKTLSPSNGMENNLNSNQKGNNNPNNNEQHLKKSQNELEVINPNDVLNQAASMNVSANTFIRLREVYVINNLKKQINQLKKVIAGKDEEIEGYKSNVRCAKYSKLEFNYSNNLNQLIQIKKENETLRSNYEEISSKFTEQIEENQKFVNSLSKYRTQYDEIKIKNKILEDANKELSSKNKYLEEKIGTLNKMVQHQPVQLTRVSLREKNNTIKRLKEEIQELKDKFRAERQRLEKRIFYISEDFKKIKEGLDLKIFKRCETDRLSLTLKIEYRKHVESLQANLKMQEELFENERNQLYDFIEKLSLDFQEIADKNNIHVEIPKFQLIPLPIKYDAEAEENNMKEIEKKYEQTEHKLIDDLIENEERIKFLSQINIENHMNDFSSTKKTDNGFFVTNNVINNDENIENVNDENNKAENAEEDQNILDNNVVNNSKINTSHASKHRLMNLNSEKSQNKDQENENKLSETFKVIDDDDINHENPNHPDILNLYHKVSSSRDSKKSKIAEEDNSSQVAFKLMDEEEVDQEVQIKEDKNNDNLDNSQAHDVEMQGDDLEGNSPKDQFNENPDEGDKKVDVVEKNNYDEVNKNDEEKDNIGHDEDKEDIDREKIISEEVNDNAEVESVGQNNNNENFEEKLNSGEIEQENKGEGKFDEKINLKLLDENPEREQNNENIELADIEGSNKVEEDVAINSENVENKEEANKENLDNQNSDKVEGITDNEEPEKTQSLQNNLNEKEEAGKNSQEQDILNDNKEDNPDMGSGDDKQNVENQSKNNSKIMEEQVNDRVDE